MAEISVDIDVDCGDCGTRLDVSVKGTSFKVGPCSKCVKEAEEAEYSRGYDAGFADGERPNA